MQVTWILDPLTWILDLASCIWVGGRSPSALLGEHPAVGLFECGRRITAGKELGDPDGDRKRRRVVSRLSQSLADRRHPCFGARLVHTRCDDEEFIATPANSVILWPELVDDETGEVLQGGVTDAATEELVDLLEVVDVDEDEDAASVDHRVHGFAEAATVREIGEWIGVDQPAQALLRLQELSIGVMEELFTAIGDDRYAGEGEHQLDPGIEEGGVVEVGEADPVPPQTGQEKSRGVQEEHALDQHCPTEPT